MRKLEFLFQRTNLNKHMERKFFDQPKAELMQKGIFFFLIHLFARDIDNFSNEKVGNQRTSTPFIIRVLKVEY